MTAVRADELVPGMWTTAGKVLDVIRIGRTVCVSFTDGSRAEYRNTELVSTL